MEAVAQVNENTIVVVNSVGPIVMEAWITNPNGSYNKPFLPHYADISTPSVTAVVWSGLPGQEAGTGF